MRMRQWLVLIVSFLVVSFSVPAEVSQADWEAVKATIENLKKENDEIKAENAAIKKTSAELLSKVAATKPSSADKALDNKFGPNANVVTKSGKLRIGALLQVWYYTLQTDHDALFQDGNVNGINDTNTASDNDSFRIRRTELSFNFDLNEHISATVMIDPAREAQSFPSFPDNQATSSIFKRGLNANLANVQGGVGSAPRMLQDAYILFHDYVPHHDFKIGQFKPLIGEEGIRSSAELDFVERSFLGQIGDQRDQGFSAHGEWWHADGKGNGQFQYWLGVFNGPGNYHGSGGQFQNRSDDNNFKDFNYRVLVRPFWKSECLGNMEMGFSGEFGNHGEEGEPDPVDVPLNGLNRRKVFASRIDGWAYYAPGSFGKGLWIRGEYQWQKDRNAPGAVIDLLGQGNAGDGTTQTNPKPFTTQGFYAAAGYRLWESPLWQCECPRWYRNFEFAGRYDVYQNVQIADPVRPDQTRVFQTQVFTAGVNYYMVPKSNTKIQMNYSVIRNPESGTGDPFVFNHVNNNFFVINFQTQF
jgi:hypothetical protein